jgi:hypothetical protein
MGEGSAKSARSSRAAAARGGSSTSGERAQRSRWGPAVDRPALLDRFEIPIFEARERLIAVLAAARDEDASNVISPEATVEEDFILV